MKSLILMLLLGAFTFTSHLQAQSLDEEIGFIYVKAEYLYETGRYEDAIVQYNLVVTKNPKYKEALVHRGGAKFSLAAYKGAKMDAIQAIELMGIDASSAALLGRSFAAMNENNAAIGSFTAAIALDDKNPQIYEWRAAVYENEDQLLKACQDYEKAMNLGSDSAAMKAKTLCGITKTKPHVPKHADPEPSGNAGNANPDNTVPAGNNTTKPDSINHSTNPGDITDNEVLNSGAHENGLPNGNTVPVKTNPADSTMVDDSEPVVVDDGLPKEDNFVNSFVVDDDLTIEISGQELGRRKISEIPSILILADENGRVTVNICVNKSGVVTKAEFNGSMSTIAKKSLVSLALRKAKEFEFAKGEYDLQCGIMVFKIKGS